MLAYERLDVYQAAIAFAELSLAVLEEIPRGYGTIADQLRRASISIPLNIAEGSGKVGIKDRRHFYAIARGSAMECGAIYDVVGLLGIADTEVAAGKALLLRIVAMLTKMCR